MGEDQTEEPGHDGIPTRPTAGIVGSTGRCCDQPEAFTIQAYDKIWEMHLGYNFAGARSIMEPPRAHDLRSPQQKNHMGHLLMKLWRLPSGNLA